MSTSTPIIASVLRRTSSLLEELNSEGVCLSHWAQIATPETSWRLTSSQLENYLEGSLGEVFQHFVDKYSKLLP